MSLTHINSDGLAHMVEVSDKEDTKRMAIAKAEIYLNAKTIEALEMGNIKKGNVLSVAQVAGIMAAKKTADIIPMCHNINLTGADIRFEIFENKIEITSTVKTIGKTGVEMEALNAASATALTIYDMCKSIDKEMVISNIRLVEKCGGKSSPNT